MVRQNSAKMGWDLHAHIGSRGACGWPLRQVERKNYRTVFIMRSLLATQLLAFLLIGMVGGAAVSVAIDYRAKEAGITAINCMLLSMSPASLSEIRI